MVSEALTGLGIFKSLLDMAKGLKDINDATVRNTAIIELQEKILAAREQQSVLAERVRDLEKEVARFENWETEKLRYQLEELPPGILVYTLKEGMENGEPPHKICGTCYQKGIKSLLHHGDQNNGLTLWKCYECGFKERTGHSVAPKIVRRPRYGRDY